MSRSDIIGNGVKFQRVCRITGYLTSTVDRWNTAKQNELKERVSHAMKYTPKPMCCHD